MKKILLIGGSVRNCAGNDILVDEIKKINNEPELYDHIEKLSRDKVISNSEGCGLAVTYGALKEGKSIEYLRLNKYIDKKGKISNSNEIIEKVLNADGYVFLTPVYFGDRSSLIFDLLTEIKKENIDFTGKVAAVCSVGAKRNGGQETTNIYTLFNLMSLNCLAVGNGPPTSQYGGTVVGGNKGTMDNDYFGIMTSQGVGSKVSRTIDLLSSEKKEKPNIAFWLLEDFKDRRLLRLLEKKIESLPNTANWEIFDFTKNQFNECIACDKCPNQVSNPDYKCILKNDDMEEIQEKLLKSDGFIVCGVNYENEIDKISVYQRFVERTRYIRRDNFRLTDHIFSSLSLNSLFSDQSYDIKVFTSFIRHNTICHRGIKYFDLNNKIIEKENNNFYQSMIDLSSRSVTHRSDKNNIHKYDEIGFQEVKYYGYKI